MLVSPTVWEDLAKTLLTTNTTWAMTKSMVARLAALGDPGPDDTRAFPEPTQIAAYEPDSLTQHVRAGYRGAYLHELATRIASGELAVEAWRDPALSSLEVYKALKQIKGFGDYAAGAMMRLLGRFDQLGLDSVCRAMYAQRYNAGVAATDREIAAYYEPFGIWRGLVVWLDVMKEDILS
jgi:3-methyladenine DNA glycosylase/8-oxoguanine DNA glycosylase